MPVNVKTISFQMVMSPGRTHKDKVPYVLKSYVIYKFLCAGCNASYVGEAYRHICTRTHEHLETDQSFNVYRHLLKNLQCKSICDENRFSILNSQEVNIPLT